ncbi:LysM peptidoglycan-binding domain-containing protein, partial [Methylibium rhizosphaerae]|uniref:LysM peptidoglycan-binding domain-containing protein n=1 Tax=Methylibium rhizosphaerae TaxID=2570323 RepID=UPI001C612143
MLQTNQQGFSLRQLVVQGQALGRYGVGPNEQGAMTVLSEFDSNFRSASSPSAVGSYRVQGGDTLRSIAQAAYGDNRLWWKIAQANGLSGDSDLRVGQTLSLP